MFVDAASPDPDAAFVIVNDPITDGARIAQLVRSGFLVRTRADADTREARSGDLDRSVAAFGSGAHVVSTDYPVEDARHPGFVVTLPGGAPARCNPVRRPAACNPADVAE